jgi:hypothetical protein
MYIYIHTYLRTYKLIHIYIKGPERRVGASELMRGYADLGSLIQEEELIIDPKHAAQGKYKRIQGGMDWKNSNDGRKEKADEFLQNRDLNLSTEDEDAPEKLLLDVDDTFRKKRVLGGHHIGVFISYALEAGFMCFM